jgi:hypothetical protein
MTPLDAAQLGNWKSAYPKKRSQATAKAKHVKIASRGHLRTNRESGFVRTEFNAVALLYERAFSRAHRENPTPPDFNVKHGGDAAAHQTN